ncbi:MAG: LuxR C-terminal-related transcriptional regulator [Chloroflexota bacterium]|nr:LuxR C-terminal-related transcriptional regulator [Chloroflexota bacterium]
MGLHQSGTLTAMEHLALRLSATGMTTAEVADHLGIDPAEARRHVAGAVAALGARSKLEAVVLAVRWGLFDLPAP